MTSATNNYNRASGSSANKPKPEDVDNRQLLQVALQHLPRTSAVSGKGFFGSSHPTSSIAPPGLFRRKVLSWATPPPTPPQKKVPREIQVAKLVKYTGCDETKERHLVTKYHLKKLHTLLRKEIELTPKGNGTALKFTLLQFLAYIKKRLPKGEYAQVPIVEVCLAGSAMKDVLRSDNQYTASDIDIRIYLDIDPNQGVLQFEHVREVVADFLLDLRGREEGPKDEREFANWQRKQRQEVIKEYLTEYQKGLSYDAQTKSNFWSVASKMLDVTFINKSKREHLFENDAIVGVIDPAIENEHPDQIVVRSAGPDIDNSLFGWVHGLVETNRAEQISGNRGFFELARRVTWGETDFQGTLDKDLYESFKNAFSNNSDDKFKSALEAYLNNHVQGKPQGKILFLINLATLIDQVNVGPDGERWRRAIDESLQTLLELPDRPILPLIRLFFFREYLAPSELNYVLSAQSKKPPAEPIMQDGKRRLHYELPHYKVLLQAILSDKEAWESFDQDYLQVHKVLREKIRTRSGSPLPERDIAPHFLETISRFLHALARGATLNKQEILLHSCRYHQRLLIEHPEVAEKLGSKERILFYAHQLQQMAPNDVTVKYEPSSLDVEMLPYLQGPRFDKRALQLALSAVNMQAHPWERLAVLPLYWPCSISKDELKNLVDAIDNPLAKEWHKNFVEKGQWEALHQLLKSCLETPENPRMLDFACTALLNASHLNLVPQEVKGALLQQFITPLATANDDRCLEMAWNLWLDEDSDLEATAEGSLLLWVAMEQRGVFEKDPQILSEASKLFSKRVTEENLKKIRNPHCITEWVSSSLRLKHDLANDLLIKLRKEGCISFKQHPEKDALYSQLLCDDLIVSAVEDGFFKSTCEPLIKWLSEPIHSKNFMQHFAVIKALHKQSVLAALLEEQAVRKQAEALFYLLIKQGEIQKAGVLFHLMSSYAGLFDLSTLYTLFAKSLVSLSQSKKTHLSRLLAKTMLTKSQSYLNPAKLVKALAKEKGVEKLIPFLCQGKKPISVPLAQQIVRQWEKFENDNMQKGARALAHLTIIKAWNRTGVSIEKAIRWWNIDVFANTPLANEATFEMILLLTKKPQIEGALFAARLLKSGLLKNKWLRHAYILLLKSYSSLDSFQKSALNLLREAENKDLFLAYPEERLKAYETVIMTLCKSGSLNLVLEAKSLLLNRFKSHLPFPKEHVKKYSDLGAEVLKALVFASSNEKMIPTECYIYHCKEILNTILVRKEFFRYQSKLAHEVILAYANSKNEAFAKETNKILEEELKRLKKEPKLAMEALANYVALYSSGRRFSEDELPLALGGLFQLLAIPLQDDEMIELAIKTFCSVIKAAYSQQCIETISDQITLFVNSVSQQKADVKNRIAKGVWDFLLELRKGVEDESNNSLKVNDVLDFFYPKFLSDFYRHLTNHDLYHPPQTDIRQVKEYVQEKIKQMSSSDQIDKIFVFDATIETIRKSDIFSMNEIINWYDQFIQKILENLEQKEAILPSICKIAALIAVLKSRRSTYLAADDQKIREHFTQLDLSLKKALENSKIPKAVPLKKALTTITKDNIKEKEVIEEVNSILKAYPEFSPILLWLIQEGFNDIRDPQLFKNIILSHVKAGKVITAIPRWIKNFAENGTFNLQEILSLQKEIIKEIKGKATMEAVSLHRKLYKDYLAKKKSISQEDLFKLSNDLMSHSIEMLKAKPNDSSTGILVSNFELTFSCWAPQVKKGVNVRCEDLLILLKKVINPAILQCQKIDQPGLKIEMCGLAVALFDKFSFQWPPFERFILDLLTSLTKDKNNEGSLKAAFVLMHRLQGKHHFDRSLINIKEQCYKTIMRVAEDAPESHPLLLEFDILLQLYHPSKSVVNETYDHLYYLTAYRGLLEIIDYPLYESIELVIIKLERYDKGSVFKEEAQKKLFRLLAERLKLLAEADPESAEELTKRAKAMKIPFLNKLL